MTGRRRSRMRARASGAGAGLFLRGEARFDFLHDGVHGRGDADGDRVRFAEGDWILQGGELTAEHRGLHEVSLPIGHALVDGVEIAGKVDELDGAGFGATQAVAVSLFEGGAGKDAGFPRRARGDHLEIEAFKPRFAIGVGERCAGAHFGDVFGRVESVGVEEPGAERLGEGATDLCFSGSGDAHDDDDAGQRGGHGEWGLGYWTPVRAGRNHFLTGSLVRG